MTGSEVMRAFRRWANSDDGDVKLTVRDYIHRHYPLFISQASRWYIRERLPGTRVWRAEEDGSFTLLGNPERVY